MKLKKYTRLIATVKKSKMQKLLLACTTCFGQNAESSTAAAIKEIAIEEKGKVSFVVYMWVPQESGLFFSFPSSQNHLKLGKGFIFY